MRELLTVLIELIFPDRTDAHTIKTASDHEWSMEYQPKTYNDVIFLSRYHHPLIEAAIKENKFYHNQEAARLLGSLLSQWSQSKVSYTIFIPIPLGKKRLRERGYNQVISILSAAQLTPYTDVTILQRNRETLPQVRLNRTDRKENIKDAFSYTGKMQLPTSCTQVILIDDVVTTGATLLAAKTALASHLPSHIKIQCLALAH